MRPRGADPESQPPPDVIFDDPRVAQVLDVLEGDRSDLDAYERIVVEELRAESALDLGCGTGVFALRLAARGVDVTGVEPARGSLAVARAKPGAGAVTWIAGTAEALPALQVDVATMTANVAQVFLTDAAWEGTLAAVHAALRPGGHLVFEVRRPEARAWERWTRAHSWHVESVPGAGDVEDWVQITRVEGELVTFESPTVFRADGVRIDSTSTLRFRSRESVEASLERTGYTVVDVRDAPDRPGLEWVFIARRD